MTAYEMRISAWSSDVGSSDLFRQIEAFRTVIACGTTTRAAEILRISQPAISRLLADLERTTKLKLFDRGKGRIRPTAEGLAFYDEVQRAFIDRKSVG